MTDKQWEPPKALIHTEARVWAERRLGPMPHGNNGWETMSPFRRRDYLDAARAALAASPLGECVAVLRRLSQHFDSEGYCCVQGSGAAVDAIAAHALLAKLEPPE